MKSLLHRSKGFGIIEALAVIVLIGIVGLGLTKNMNDNLRNGQRFRIREAAESLVRSQMEIYSMVNPNSLTTETLTEEDLTYHNLSSAFKFDRTTAITASGSLITINVSVESLHPLFPMDYSGRVDFTTW